MRIVEWTPRRARHLADLWNASDAAWPAGLVRGRPKSPGEARESERRSDALARYLALDGDRPVGYVRLLPWWDSPDGTYVQWLDVDPRYHGKGIGKALLLRAIEKTVELGQPRIDLHTWPGNDKAMPLYKRTGFMWVPGSHAYLQNFIPLLLSYEPARPFFVRHPWLGSLERDLTRDHDADSLHGVDVFVYRFRGGRDRIEAAVDRNARQVTAFEDGRVRVEAWVPGASLVEAMDGTIRWSVRNKGRESASVAIALHVPEGVKARVPEPFVLGPGRAKEVRGQVTIPESFPDPPEEWASPSLESTVTVGGRSFRLRSGFRPKAALDIGWERHEAPLPSPGTRTATLLVRNQSGRSLRGILRISPHDIHVDRTRLTIAVPKGGLRRVRLRLGNPATESRVGRLRIVFESSPVRVVKNLAIPCVAPGGSLAYAQGDTWYLATPVFRFVSKGVGAEGILELHDGTKVMGSVWTVPGPPFWPSDSEHHRWEGRLDPAGGAEIVRRFASRRRPGMVIEQRWRVRGDRLLELGTALENRGAAPWSASVRVVCEKAFEHAVTTIPTARGIFREAFMESEWPDQRDDVPLGRLLAEDWIHVGSEDAGCGILWTPDSDGRRPLLEMEAGSAASWHTPEVRVPAGGRIEFPPTRMLVARDWRDVRDRWAHGSSRSPEDLAVLTGSLSCTFDPPVVLASPSSEISVTLRNLRRRPVSGTVWLEPGSGLKASKARHAVGPLDLDREWRRTVRVSGRGPKVTATRVILEETRSRHAWEVPVVVSDGTGAMQFRREDDRRTVDNGLLSFAASTRHSGSLVSLRREGHEYLVSTYPTPGTFSWFRPFFGGICPMLFEEDWPGDLYKESFRAVPGRRGTWRGLALSARAGRSSLSSGLSVRVEYLTRPGSPLLSLAMTVRNGTPLRRTLTGGFWTILGRDGKPVCEAEFHRLRPRHWREAPWAGWSSADEGFAVFRAPHARTSVAVVAAAPGVLEVIDLRGDGRHGVVQRQFELKPGQSGTLLAMLAVVPRAQAAAYRVLRHLTASSFEAARTR